jgi:hypothetical protein
MRAVDKFECRDIGVYTVNNSAVAVMLPAAFFGVAGYRSTGSNASRHR